MQGVFAWQENPFYPRHVSDGAKPGHFIRSRQESACSALPCSAGKCIIAPNLLSLDNIPTEGIFVKKKGAGFDKQAGKIAVAGEVHRQSQKAKAEVTQNNFRCP